MLRELLLVALTTMSYASTLTIESSDNTANISYSQNDFIDPSSPNFRLGDYEVKSLVYDSVMGRSRIEVIIPYTVFDDLSEFETVFISIPGYSSNPSLFLYMNISFYDQQGFFDYVISELSTIPLNEFMLAKTGFTVTDNPPYYENLFDPQLWDYNYLNYEIRLNFYVPTDFVNGTPNFLRDITLFTKLGSYWDGYSDGADNGYDDGYIDGYDDGYDDGVDNGYDDGFIDGIADGYSDGYIDGVQDGITQAEGTWLGNLIFGTVGSVVGFIFAISDFEVLGVSIMSIITLFVAIGVIMLFIKLIKGTN
jgi:hypothetical protein